jgi:hypothetical protein
MLIMKRKNTHPPAACQDFFINSANRRRHSQRRVENGFSIQIRFENSGTNKRLNLLDIYWTGIYKNLKTPFNNKNKINNIIKLFLLPTLGNIIDSIQG